MKKNYNEKFMVESNGYVWHNPFYAEIEKKTKENRIQNMKKEKLKRINKMNNSKIQDIEKFTVTVNRRVINDIDFDMPTNPSAYKKIKFR